MGQKGNITYKDNLNFGYQAKIAKSKQASRNKAVAKLKYGKMIEKEGKRTNYIDEIAKRRYDIHDKKDSEEDEHKGADEEHGEKPRKTRSDGRRPGGKHGARVVRADPLFRAKQEAKRTKVQKDAEKAVRKQEKTEADEKRKAYHDKRARQTKIMRGRTRRGQPNLADRMTVLLEKITEKDQ